MNRKVARASAAICAVLIAAGSYAGAGVASGPASAPPSDAAGEPTSGGTLVYGVSNETPSLDPIASAGTGGTGGAEMMAIYDALIVYNPETNEFEPRTAESLEPNDDATVWTLKLREGITFSDGTPYDANAVKFNIERGQSDDSRLNFKALLKNITEVEVVDDLTVNLHLADSWGGVPFLLSTTAGMLVSPTAAEALGDQLGLDPVGAGAGPFVIDSFTPLDSIKLVRNDTYWGGEVYLDGITFLNAGGAAEALQGLESDAYDSVFLRSPQAVQGAIDGGFGSAINVVGLGGVIQPSFGFTIENEDGTKTEIPSITSDVRVRRAVAMAIDPAAINERIYDGNGLMGTSVFSETSPWHTDGAADANAYDPEAAAALVEEVKAEGWDGTIRLDCSDVAADLSVLIESMLGAVGFTVDAAPPLPSADFLDLVFVQKDFDLLCGWSLQVQDALPYPALFNAFASVNAPNAYGYSNPDMDAALQAAKVAVTDEAANAAYAEISAIVAEDVATIPFEFARQMVTWADDVHGVHLSSQTVPIFDDAWIG